MSNPVDKEPVDKVIDMKQVKGPLLDDLNINYNGLDMNNQPEIVHAIHAAIQGTNIPNGHTYEDVLPDGKIVVGNYHTAYMAGEEINSISAEGTKNGKSIELQNSSSHNISLSFNVTNLENGNYQVQLAARHDGSFDPKVIDARATLINYEITPAGEILSRDAHALDFGKDPNNEWTIRAAQALEHRFAQIMGDVTAESLKKFRPETAATTVDAPPIGVTLNSLRELSEKPDVDSAAKLQNKYSP